MHSVGNNPCYGHVCYSLNPRLDDFNASLAPNLKLSRSRHSTEDAPSSNISTRCILCSLFGWEPVPIGVLSMHDLCTSLIHGIFHY